MDNFKGTKWSLGGISGRMIKTNEYNGYVADVDTKKNALLISKAPEMLQLLNRINNLFIRKSFPTEIEMIEYSDEIEKLLKEATEL